jgi:phage FluMu gp28-like protein
VFERRMIQIPSDTDVTRDLALIRRVNGVPKIPDVRTDSVSNAGSKRHGDAAVAIFLANVGCEQAEQLYVRWEALSDIGDWRG